MSTKHSLAAAEFLKDREKASWHDRTLWMVRQKRDRMSRSVPEWEQLRDAACALKMYSNSHLAELLAELPLLLLRQQARRETVDSLLPRRVHVLMDKLHA